MPDWLIHLAVSYLISKLLKIRDISLVLIGTLLPDISRVLAILDFFNLSATAYYALLMPLHSPFTLVFLATATSFLFKRPLRSFLLIILGSAIHLILDQLQSAYYTGKLLLYPFSYHPFKSFNVFWADSSVALVLIVISFFILVYAIFDKNKKPLKFTHKKIHLTIFFLLISLTIPFLTYNAFIEKDPYIQQFQNNNKELYFSYAVIISDPYIQQFQNNNKELYFSYAVIISENPLILKEMDYEYEIINQIKVNEKDWISAKADRIGNKIFIKEYYKHNKYLKEGASVIGLIMFIIILFNNPKRYKKTNIKHNHVK